MNNSIEKGFIEINIMLNPNESIRTNNVYSYF